MPNYNFLAIFRFFLLTVIDNFLVRISIFQLSTNSENVYIFYQCRLEIGAFLMHYDTILAGKNVRKLA